MSNDWDFVDALGEQQATEDGGHAAIAPATVAAPVQLYALPVGQTQNESEPGFFSRKFLGLPIWGWSIGALAAAAGGGYLYYSKSLAANDGEDDAGSASDGEETSGSGGGFRTSRGETSDKISGWLSKRGLSSGVTIYSDADEAKKKLKTVSPLITLKTTVPVPVAELDKFCRRDGLSCTEHDGGVIGLYPTTSRRGKAWEKYIDDLRDEGQTV